MRRGFTMIELVFVIVILGILAAVALPRLAATRDDARVSAMVSTVTTIKSAVPPFFFRAPADTVGTGSLQSGSNQLRFDTLTEATDWSGWEAVNTAAYGGSTGTAEFYYVYRINNNPAIIAYTDWFDNNTSYLVIDFNGSAIQANMVADLNQLLNITIDAGVSGDVVGAEINATLRGNGVVR